MAPTSGEFVFHIFIIDIAKYLLFYIIIPAFAIFLLYLSKLHKKIINTFDRMRNWFELKKLEKEFNDIFENEEENKLKRQYIRNALITAGSNNVTEKITAIKQLAQFREAIVCRKLLKLLCNEKDVGMRKILISALNKVAC